MTLEGDCLAHSSFNKKERKKNFSQDIRTVGRDLDAGLLEIEIKIK
jgi:hypothetical protein